MTRSKQATQPVVEIGRRAWQLPGERVRRCGSAYRAALPRVLMEGRR